MNKPVTLTMMRGLLALTVLAIGVGPGAQAQRQQAPGSSPSQEPAALAAADAPGASLAARIDSVLPTADDDRFLSIPWRTNLMAARREAQTERRPIFLWMMVGNPLGCT